MFKEKIRNIKRLKEIIQVLFKYELGFLLERLNLRSHLSLKERLKVAMFEETETQPEKVRKIFGRNK